MSLFFFLHLLNSKCCTEIVDIHAFLVTISKIQIDAFCSGVEIIAFHTPYRTRETSAARGNERDAVERARPAGIGFLSRHDALVSVNPPPPYTPCHGRTYDLTPLIIMPPHTGEWRRRYGIRYGSRRPAKRQAR